MSIGFRIKEARKSLGITQTTLAEKIGVTKGAIANYENEVSVPKVDLLYKLMQVLNVDANYLYQDEMQSNHGTKKVALEKIENDIDNMFDILVEQYGSIPKNKLGLIIKVAKAILESDV